MSVLKDLASFVQKLFTLGKELEQNRADIKELRHDVQSLVLRVEQIANRLEMLGEREAAEREKLALQLQLALLKFERRLQPPRTTTKIRNNKLTGVNRPHARWTLERGAC
jgi:chromosome segregation ATPase